MKNVAFIFILLLFFSKDIYSEEYYHQDVNDDFYTNVVEQYEEKASIDPYILDSSPEGIFTLNSSSEISTTFLNEGAGYRNSFGLFTVDQNNNGEFLRHSMQKYEIFANASKLGSGGYMETGDSYKSDPFPESTNFGFYIESNGYNNRYFSNTFYSYTPFNRDKIKHTILTYDYSKDKLVIGFEDLYNGGDKDYNDLIISVFTNPVDELRSSISGSGIANIYGNQTLGDASGMVTMTVAGFGRISVSEEIVLYPEEFGQQINVNFSGKGSLIVESNTGVLISGALTNLSNGLVEIPVNYLIDGQSQSLYTTGSETHNDIHEIEIMTVIENISLIESSDFVGNLSLTMSVY